MTEQQILEIINEKAKTDGSYRNFARSLRINKKYKPRVYKKLIDEMSKCNNEEELVALLEE